MVQVGIVVLNYKNYTETIQCVHSILEQDMVCLNVVIVDNGSNNNSYEIILGEFGTEKNVHIIKNDKNLGYSKGNNVGITYLRNLGINFIIVCNSDITFSENSIIRVMAEACNESVGVMIPIIKNLDGTIEMRAQYKRRFFPLRILKELKRMQKNSKSRNIHNRETTVIDKLEPGIQNEFMVITGSIFALTPSYFKVYGGLYPETFLYVEELATLLLVYKAKLKCAIVNTKDVIHKGQASTAENKKNGTIEKKKMVASSAKLVQKLVFLPSFWIRNKYWRKK